MADATTRHALPLLMASQAQKHVTHNEALKRLDALLHPMVEGMRDEPPEAPAEGQAFLVGANPSGLFAGKAGWIAAFADGAFTFIDPRNGTIVLDGGTGRLLLRHAGAWIDLASLLGLLDAAALGEGRASRIGVNTAADAVNRLAVKSRAVLLSHEAGSGSLQVVLNKERSADSATILFQTGWSGRAEFGPAGDDAFQIKVSADGVVWRSALRIDPDSADVALPGGLSIGGAVSMGGPARLKTYARAALPAPQGRTGALVYVGDESGGGVPAFSDGAAWRRVTDRAIVS